MVELRSIQPFTSRLMSEKSATMLRESVDPCGHRDLDDGVVPVRMLADAVVVSRRWP